MIRRGSTEEERLEEKALKHGMLPRPGGLKPRTRRIDVSPLAAYMELGGISVRSMSLTTGFSQKTIMDLMSGEHEPRTSTAYVIEVVTKGAVPMEAWVAVPNARKRIALAVAEAPEEVQRLFTFHGKKLVKGR